MNGSIQPYTVYVSVLFVPQPTTLSTPVLTTPTTKDAYPRPETTVPYTSPEARSAFDFQHRGGVLSNSRTSSLSLFIQGVAVLLNSVICSVDQV